MDHGNTEKCNYIHLVVLNVHSSTVVDNARRLSAGKEAILTPSNVLLDSGHHYLVSLSN